MNSGPEDRPSLPEEHDRVFLDIIKANQFSLVSRLEAVRGMHNQLMAGVVAVIRECPEQLEEHTNIAGARELFEIIQANLEVRNPRNTRYTSTVFRAMRQGFGVVEQVLQYSQTDNTELSDGVAYRYAEWCGKYNHNLRQNQMFELLAKMGAGKVAHGLFYKSGTIYQALAKEVMTLAAPLEMGFISLDGQDPRTRHSRAEGMLAALFLIREHVQPKGM